MKFFLLSILLVILITSKYNFIVTEQSIGNSKVINNSSKILFKELSITYSLEMENYYLAEAFAQLVRRIW